MDLVETDFAVVYECILVLRCLRLFGKIFRLVPIEARQIVVAARLAVEVGLVGLFGRWISVYLLLL